MNLGGDIVKKKIFLQIAVLALMASTACIIASSGLDGAAASPATDFMAAALRNQETACGASLEIRYRHIGHDVNEGKVAPAVNIHYIRTPDALFVEQELPSNSPEAPSNPKESFDRKTGEYKLLLPDVNNKSTGMVRGYLHGFFLNQDFVETTQYHLFEGVLWELIERGVVGKEQDQIDGHSCWRIEVLSTRDAIDKYVIWVDPAIGFCPRRVEVYWKTVAPQVINFKDYKEISTGVWFPMEHTVDLNTAKGRKLHVVSIVDKVEVGREIPKSELLVQFPSGTKVRMGKPAIVYTVP